MREYFFKRTNWADVLSGFGLHLMGSGLFIASIGLAGLFVNGTGWILLLFPIPGFALIALGWFIRKANPSKEKDDLTDG